MLSFKMPFINRTKEEWQNLGITAILAYYILRILAEVFFHNTFMVLGGDFLSFWSAGYLANTANYSAAYNLQNIGNVEFQFIPKPPDITNYHFIPLPTIFLPIFLLPFQALALIPLLPSFIIWSSINFFGYIGYLVWFCKKLEINFSRRTILLMLLFWPTYLSLLWGQIGLFLLIPIGEFYRALISKKPFLAGAWLSLLLIKPQVLLLIVPFMLIFRQLKALTGFIIPALILIALSFWIAGWQGMSSWLQLLHTVSTNGVTSIGAKGMLNWRMLGLNLNDITHSTIGNWITIFGTIITLILLIIIIKSRNNFYDARTHLAIFSATALVSPHFHIHSAILITPFLLMLFEGKNKFRKIIELWVFIPPIVLMIVSIILLLFKIYNPIFIRSFGIEGASIGLSSFSLMFFTFIISHD